MVFLAALCLLQQCMKNSGVAVSPYAGLSFDYCNPLAAWKLIILLVEMLNFKIKKI
jgi:hypothetical protein